MPIKHLNSLNISIRYILMIVTEFTHFDVKLAKRFLHACFLKY